MAQPTVFSNTSSSEKEHSRPVQFAFRCSPEEYNRLLKIVRLFDCPQSPQNGVRMLLGLPATLERRPVVDRAELKKDQTPKARPFVVLVRFDEAEHQQVENRLASDQDFTTTVSPRLHTLANYVRWLMHRDVVRPAARTDLKPPLIPPK